MFSFFLSFLKCTGFVQFKNEGKNDNLLMFSLHSPALKGEAADESKTLSQERS